MTDDVELLRRRLALMAKAANGMRSHVGDLWVLGWERPVVNAEPDRGNFESSMPSAGDPRARALFDQMLEATAKIEAELVGLERAMRALFFAGSENPRRSLGSTISRAQFDQLKRNQQRRREAGEYTPTLLMSQPQHPGKK